MCREPVPMPWSPQNPPDAPPPAGHRRSLVGSLVMLGLLVLAGLLDLYCRFESLSSASTFREVLIMTVQAAVCGILLVAIPVIAMVGLSGSKRSDSQSAQAFSPQTLTSHRSEVGPIDLFGNDASAHSQTSPS